MAPCYIDSFVLCRDVPRHVSPHADHIGEGATLRERLNTSLALRTHPSSDLSSSLVAIWPEYGCPHGFNYAHQPRPDIPPRVN